jgi:hypothetical protein
MLTVGFTVDFTYVPVYTTVVANDSSSSDSMATGVIIGIAAGGMVFVVFVTLAIVMGFRANKAKSGFQEAKIKTSVNSPPPITIDPDFIKARLGLLHKQ